MIELNTLSKPVNWNKKRKKRVGRGTGCHGTFSGRGCKGSKSRSGHTNKWGYEGGQMPLHRRLPKRGFLHLDKTEFNVINLDTLNKYYSDGESVDKTNLENKGLLKNKNNKVKILGRGDLTKKLNITADKISKSAFDKITAAGGSVVKIKVKKFKSKSKIKK